MGAASLHAHAQITHEAKAGVIAIMLTIDFFYIYEVQLSSFFHLLDFWVCNGSFCPAARSE